jgi:hypothetical protein
MGNETTIRIDSEHWLHRDLLEACRDGREAWVVNRRITKVETAGFLVTLKVRTG